VRLPVIEAVVGRAPRILPEQPLRRRGPDVVVSGSQVEWKAAVRLENPLRLLPLFGRGCIVQTFNGVSDANHESRMPGCRRLPGVLINPWNRFARPVAEDYEAERTQFRRSPGYRQGKQQHRDRSEDPRVPRYRFVSFRQGCVVWF